MLSARSEPYNSTPPHSGADTDSMSIDMPTQMTYTNTCEPVPLRHQGQSCGYRSVSSGFYVLALL